MKNSLNGRYHTRVVVNIIYSTVVACMVMVFLVTNLSMIGQYAAERGMENSLVLLFYRPGTMIVLLYVLLGIGVFSVSFLLLQSRSMRYISRISSAMREIAEGDLNITLDVEGDDEFADMAENLNNMVEELLDFSRLQNGRIRMDCRPLDLVAELTDAVLFCEARIQREGLVLSYTEPEEMIPVYADPDRLRQVFINIMDNAIKYSAPGGRITVKLWAGEYKAFAEIIDQGRGIPPEDLENVKTKFYKGSNSVRGSGIGLALVDSIMTALDGTMDIKSTLGRGTVVTLGLPLYHKA